MIITQKSRIAPHWRVVINAGLFLLCCILLVSIGQMFRGLRASKERLGYVNQSHKQALDQHADLSREYRDLTTPDGLEYYVRNHYRAISAGEELVVVVDPHERFTVEAPPIITWQERLRLFLRIP